MSEENTQNLQGGRSFEDRIFAKLESIDARFDAVETRFDARFDGVDGAIRDLDARVERLEIRSYDTKPIWEQALKEILETKREVAETRRLLTKRLDRFESIVLETRADLRDAEERIDKLETKPVQ